MWVTFARGTPAPARLEDGFMTILREQRKALARKPDETEIPQEESAALSSYDKFQPETGRNAEPEVVIEVRDLVRRFGSFVAVDNTSFTVGRGEVFGLIGPNGAGKTTTFRMLCGLLPASGGTLRVAGVDLRTARARAR